MIRKRSADEGRIWAMRDRSAVPRNKTRARTMRSSPTKAEQRLWWHLRHRLATPASHFRRQVHLGRYIVDSANHKLKVVIEIDGGQHADQIKHDEKRTKFLESQGYRVVRFWNNEILENIDGVLEMIQNAVFATPTPAPPHKGEGTEGTSFPYA